MQLQLEKLGSKELKALFLAVKEERGRRGKKNPANHDPVVWAIPKTAVDRSASAGT